MYISIIIPTYNSEKFIKRSLDSLLCQTYKKFEVIVSDDGSTDGTFKILLKYKNIFKKKKIEFKILNNDHRGPGYARNKGIIKSKYKWLAFLDSDDKWQSNKLFEVVKIILKKKFNCITHNEYFKKINGDLLKINYKKKFNPKKKLFEQLFIRNFLSTSAITIKKNIIVKAGFFNEKYANAQDYDLWLRISDSLKIYFINKYLGFYFERKGNITSKPYKDRIKNLIKIIKQHKKKTGRILYYYKLLRFFFSKEWFKLT